MLGCSMKRRNLIRVGAGTAFTGGIVSLAGCSGSEEAPPRKSQVFEDAQLSSNGTLTVPLADDQWVMTRMDGTTNESSNAFASSGFLSSLSPIGTVAAKGRGATGRGAGGFSSAPKTSSGFGWYGWGAYASTWYDDNEESVRQVPVEPTTVGLAYIGDNESFQEQAPGPGPVNWDVTKENVNPEEVTFEEEITQEGWYRLGVQIQPREGQDVPVDELGWESLDFRVEEENGELTVTEEWKVSPRI